MPIQLTTPLPVIPELDPSVTAYNQVTIISFNYRANKLELVCVYGNTQSGEWRSGNIPRRTFVIEGAEFTSIIAEMPQAGETLFQGASRVLYEYLIDNGHYSGTII